MAEMRDDEACPIPRDVSFTAAEGFVAETEAGNIDAAQLTAALQALLVDKGLLADGEVEQEIARIEAPGPHLGARLVVRAWTNGAFRQRLLKDGKTAAAELGFKIGEAQLVVVENTPRDHNLIVCTLCSCYPRSLLGQPPTWYISKSYRARAVREPRAVLREFGLDVPNTVRVRVHDSNADMRYLVLPMRPEGTDAWSENDLLALVTRDTLIGTAIAQMGSVEPAPCKTGASG